MKASLEVTITLKYKTDISNHSEGETLCQSLENLVTSEVQSTLGKPIFVRGKWLTPEVKINSGIPFVELNW